MREWFALENSLHCCTLCSAKNSLSWTSNHIGDHQLSDKVHDTTYHRFHIEGLCGHRLQVNDIFHMGKGCQLARFGLDCLATSQRTYKLLTGQ